MQDSVTKTSSEVSKMASPPRMSETDRPDVRYRQTTNVAGPSESGVQAVKAVHVAAASPSHGSKRLLMDTVISTLKWDNDIRRDPIVIVVLITCLFL